MVTPSLFHETLNEAVKDCVNAAGGAKAVACKLWPEKAPDAAHRLLLSCLNEDRPEHLTPEQLVMVLRLARAKSCHIGVAYILRDLGYADPQPIEPRDEAAELQRGETMYTVVPKAKRACDKPTRQGPKLVDVHEHLPSRARKPGAKCPPLQGSEMERPLPTAGVTIDPHWHLRTGEQIVGVETVRSLGLSAGHDPRYQCGPDEQVPAIFSGRKYGEYTEPASTWAKAAMRGAA